jgi:hypothetical protein
MDVFTLRPSTILSAELYTFDDADYYSLGVWTDKATLTLSDAYNY